MTAVCKKCGKLLIDYKSGNHRYCDDCRSIIRRESVKEAKKRYNEKQRLKKLVSRGVMKLCEKCEMPFKHNAGNQKYCKSCNEIVQRENYLKRIRKFRVKWKNRGEVLCPSPGTGWLGAKPKSDFNVELESVRREYKRLGLRYL